MPGARKPRARLSAESILDDAEAIVRADGLQGLTMATLAARLGADRTAVYRHFASKDALLAALLDRVLRRVELPDSKRPPKEQLLRLASSLVELLGRHPGAVALMAAAPYSPASARLVDEAVAGLIRAGCKPKRAARAAQAMLTLVLGTALQQSATADGFWAGIRTTGTPTPALDAAAGVWDRDADAAFQDAAKTLATALLG